MIRRNCHTALALGLMLGSLGAGSAHAELAPPLRSLLDTTLAGGNEADIDTVAKYLKKTSPADSAEIDRLIAAHKTAAAEAKREKLATQTLFEGWKGEGQIGASQASGNSDTLDLALGLALTKEGLHWRHKLRGQFDEQRSNGVTSGNRIAASWEPDYKFSDRLFVFALAQYERDRFAGFASRETFGTGLGYRVVAAPRFTLDTRLGPSWRRTAPIGEPRDSTLTGYGAIDAMWKVTPSIALTESASVLSASDNTATASLTALTAKLNSALSARLAWQLTSNSHPPEGYRKTDTLTRFTLVYGF